VTPDEIRAIGINFSAPAVPPKDYDVGFRYEDTRRRLEFSVLREIAAQLAEQNEQIRETRQQTKAFREEDRAANAKRDAIMAEMAESQKGFLTPPPPPVRLEYPGTVTHLGCIIREPDGAYKIATNQGQLLKLAEADFQRLFAPPVSSEAKPS
jgi:hypothetical protein